MADRWRTLRFTRLEPFRDLMDVQSEINRTFDTYFGHRPVPALGRSWAPAVDVHETKDDLVVTVELPGVNEKDIHLSIVGDLLTLRGQRVSSGEVPEESYHRIERWSGSFERQLDLPVPVQADKVRASYRDGLLEIRLPKIEAIRPREIKIEVG